MFRRLINRQINSITIAAFLVAISSLVSRFLGVFRDRILAGEFGAGETLDIYYSAFRIPDLIFNLLVLGALSAGFIPIFTKLIRDIKCDDKVCYSESHNSDAWKFVSNILNIMTVTLLVISVIGIFFAPWIVKLITPGFSEQMQIQATSLSRIMFLSPLFLGISSIIGGVLQSFKRFFVYALSPILYNVGIVIGAIYFVPIWGVYGLAWGVVLGAAVHMLIQVPTFFRLGFKYSLKFDLYSKNFREVLTMMIPRTMSLAITQINFLVITVIASKLSSGSLSVFNFANNLQSFPIGIFGISFAIAAFPVMSAVAFEKKKLVSNFSSTLRQIMFFVIPSTILLMTLRAQIIRVILGTGAFDWQDTIATIQTLGFFTLSLFAQASIPLLTRVFYARHNSKTPFFIGIVSVAVNLALSLWLGPIMGVAGLALAFSVASVVNYLLLFLFIYFEIGNFDQERIALSIFKFLIAGVASGFVIQYSKGLLAPIIDMTRVWGVFVQGAVAGSAGILVYLLICYLLRSEEFFSFWHSIKRRLPGAKISTGDRGEARGI